jgi:hypothetical protein
MRSCDSLAVGPREEHRQTIRGEDRARRAGGVRDCRVCHGQHRGCGARYTDAMHLIEPRRFKFEPELLAQAAPILEHAIGLIAHMQGQVE